MKYIAFIVLTILFSTPLFCQTTDGFNYQAAVRTLDGKPVVNTEVRIRISILDNTNTGNVLFRETHLQNTNTTGLISIVIGSGAHDFGDFQKIKWSDGLKFIKTEFALDGSSNYTIENTSQLNSVPYALYAKSAGYNAGTGIKIEGSTISNIGDTSSSNELQTLSLTNNMLSISGGNTVNLLNSASNILPLFSLDEILNMTDQAQGTTLICEDNNSIYYFLGSNWYKLTGTKQSNGDDIVIQDCLVAYYTFDDKNGDDYFGPYEGTVTGVQFSNDVNSNINEGSSATFDGNDRITIPVNPVKGFSQGSILFWIKSSAQGTILFAHTGLGTAFRTSILTNLGKKHLHFNEGLSFNADLTPYLNNSWNHFALTISNTEYKLYINGTLIEQQSNTQGMTGTNYDGMLVGEQESQLSKSFIGKLDNIRIFCKALTSEEVNEIYEAGQ